eukprot:gene27926-8851_t
MDPSGCERLEIEGSGCDWETIIAADIGDGRVGLSCGDDGFMACDTDATAAPTLTAALTMWLTALGAGGNGNDDDDRPDAARAARDAFRSIIAAALVNGTACGRRLS